MASCNGGVTFIWAIENFDEIFTGKLVSPVFQSNSLDRSEWIISMDPSKNEDSFSLVLTRCARNQEDVHNKIILDCELAIIKEDGSSLVSKEVKNHGFTTDHSWSPCQNFASRDDVFQEGSEFIRYNVLRVRCRMWRRFNESTQSELRWNHTKIERSFFVWKLTNFSRLRKNYINTIAIKNSLSETLTLTLNFQIKITKGEFVIKIISHEISNLELFCEIAVMDCKGGISDDKRFVCDAMNHASSGAQEFQPQTWEFLEFIKFGELLKKRNLYLPMDVLSLRVDCFFLERNAENEQALYVPIQNLQVREDFPSSPNCSSQRKTELALSTSDKESMTENTERPQTWDKQCMTEFDTNHTNNSCENTHAEETSNENPTTHSLESFVHDMHSMYEEGLLSDFTLCAGNRTFPVHKSVLSARSPVFKAMFTTPLKEKDGKTLDIPDIDADTLHRMLLFVYSNETRDLEWEDALNLYFAADKYNIEDLKNLTRSILKAKLSVSNVCEIMVHADLHEDPELKSSAMDFIVENDQAIIGTDYWIKFQKKYMHLAMEILSVLYTVVRKRKD